MFCAVPLNTKACLTIPTPTTALQVPHFKQIPFSIYSGFGGKSSIVQNCTMVLLALQTRMFTLLPHPQQTPYIFLPDWAFPFLPWASFPVNNLGEILPKHFLITYFPGLKIYR